METPIISADSRRVETEERRLWWELRFEEGCVGCEELEMSLVFVEFETEREEIEDVTDVLREWEGF